MKISIVPAASFLLSGILAAQQPVESVRDAAFREAERYVNCLMSGNVSCVEEMTPRERLAASGASAEINHARNLMQSRETLLRIVDYHRMEVARPWPPIAIGDSLFAFVPTFETYGILEFRRRADGTGYLIGVSDDGGGIWRFIIVTGASTVTLDEMERFMPGYGDLPTPEIVRISIEETAFERSRWLETTRRDFVAVDEAFAYSLEVGIREGLELPLDLIVSYDDPSGRSEPLQYHGSLESGQRILQWESPALSGFETGETYYVVIEGKEPASGRTVFEHRQALLFQPTYEHWVSVLSQPPSPDPELASLPAAERMRETARRAAERYAACWEEFNTLCVEASIARDQLAAAGLLEAQLANLRARFAAFRTAPLMVAIHRMEVAAPWPAFAIGEDYFSLVPCFESFSLPDGGTRIEQMSYLIGVSADGGESWRFIHVLNDSAPSPDEIDLVMPGHGNSPRPELREIEVNEPPLVRSRWVDTTERSIVAVGGGHAYDLSFAVRREYEGAVDFVIRYDDPADPHQPLLYRGSLLSGQYELQWQSPALTGFEAGKTYAVVIEGRRADSGSRLFEHRDQVLFQPTRELWLASMANPPEQQ